MFCIMLSTCQLSFTRVRSANFPNSSPPRRLANCDASGLGVVSASAGGQTGGGAGRGVCWGDFLPLGVDWRGCLGGQSVKFVLLEAVHHC